MLQACRNAGRMLFSCKSLKIVYFMSDITWKYKKLKLWVLIRTSHMYRNIYIKIFTALKSTSVTQAAGLKVFPPPKEFGGMFAEWHIQWLQIVRNFSNMKLLFPEIEYPERRKLRVMEKVPQFPPGIRPPRMQKRLRYMRGPENVHNFLMYRQYGIMVSLQYYTE